MLVTAMQSCRMLVTSLWGAIYQLCGEDDYVIAVYGEVLECCNQLVSVSMINPYHFCC